MGDDMRRGRRRLCGPALLLVFTIVLSACSISRGRQAGSAVPGTPTTAVSVLPASANISTAEQVVRDPSTGPLPANQQLADAITLGYNIVVNTPQYAPQYVGSSMSCGNCHLNAGQRDKGFPLAGIAGMFPEYSSRDQRLISLEDRIRSCFARSENGTAPPYDSKELLAVAAYITWISAGQPAGQNPSWRHQNVIPAAQQLPANQLDRNAGQQLYAQNCASCHGSDGQGVQLSPTLKPGPLWGDKSYNDGAGLAKVETLAGFIRYTMPYSNPGTLSDAQAQQIAAFIDSQPRPHFQGQASAGC